MKLKLGLALGLFLLVFVGFSQVKSRSMDFATMLTEYYGEAEYQRKLSCCQQQIERKEYILSKSYFITSTLKDGMQVSSTIESVTFTPKNEVAYTKSAQAVVAMIEAGKFNILISDIVIHKDDNRVYKLADTDYYLFVYSEAGTTKNFISSKK